MLALERNEELQIAMGLEGLGLAEDKYLMEINLDDLKKLLLGSALDLLSAFC